MTLPDARPGYGPADPGYRRVTVALFLAGVATFASIYATQPLLPLLARDFAITPAAAAASVSVTTLCLGASLLIVGPLSDAVGRRPVMLASLLLSGAICLATAFVSDWTHLLALRGALGVAVAGLPAVATAYLREEIHHHWATAATGLYIGGTAIGGMAGRLLTGLLATLFDWRAAVAGVGVLALACGVAVAFLLPRSLRFAATPLRPAALAANARRMVFDRGLLTLYALGFCLMGAFVALFNGLSFRLDAPPYLLTPAAASLIYLTYAVGSFASSYAGRLASQHGSRAVEPWAIAVFGGGILLTLATPLPVVVAGVCLVSIGFFGSHGVASAWVSARASRKGPGTGLAASLYLFAYYLGSSICGAAAGAAWSAGGWPAVVALSASGCLVGLLLSLSMRGVPVLPVRVEAKPVEH